MDNTQKIPDRRSLGEQARVGPIAHHGGDTGEEKQ